MFVHCLIHRTYIIQYHEVIGGLIGPWGERAALFFNVVSLVGLAVVQIIACASDAYYLYDGLNKRWDLLQCASVAVDAYLDAYIQPTHTLLQQYVHFVQACIMVTC